MVAPFEKTPAYDLCHNRGFSKEETYLVWDLAKRDKAGPRSLML